MILQETGNISEPGTNDSYSIRYKDTPPKASLKKKNYTVNNITQNSLPALSNLAQISLCPALHCIAVFSWECSGKVCWTAQNIFAITHVLLSSWCESQGLTTQPPSSHRLRFSANTCSVLWAGELLTWLLALAPLQHILTLWGHLWPPASPEGSAVKGRQGCQASNSRKSNNNVTHMYTFPALKCCLVGCALIPEKFWLSELQLSFPALVPLDPVLWGWAAGVLGAGAIATQAERLQAITGSSLCFSLPREGLESPLVFF